MSPVSVHLIISASVLDFKFEADADSGVYPLLTFVVGNLSGYRGFAFVSAGQGSVLAESAHSHFSGTLMINNSVFNSFSFCHVADSDQRNRVLDEPNI